LSKRVQTGPNTADLLERVHRQLGRVPRAAWLCAAVACLNAACWSILTPPFQVTDEPTHFAYTQQIAENDALPNSSRSSLSQEEEAVLRDLEQYVVRESPETRTISTAKQQARLEGDLNKHLSRRGSGGIGGASSDPPLYYLLETIPYGLAASGTLLDQLELMRLLSALMAGLTALFVFLFLRETLPSARWAWTVGALSVALAPLLGFVSGGVNPESMLVAISAASFYLLARGFRRGFTRNLAIATGLTMIAGLLTKPNFIGLVPGIAIGLVLLSVRAARSQGRVAYTWLGMSLAIAAAPVLLYLIVNVASGHPPLGVVSSVLKLQGAHGSILDKLSYIWQLYLPRLPGMTNRFPGLSTTRDMWFNNGVGLYGWLDTSFPVWVDNLAVIPVAALALLCARSLVLCRAAVRRRLAELAVYAAMALGLLALIGLNSYINSSEGLFTDPRYLLPLLPILGAATALAARGAGRRWGPTVGAAIIVLFLAHNIFSQLLVSGRYYA
jgi:4-amino-4-deoxy-L-arabinose transferase-like glycosyltransferase